VGVTFDPHGESASPADVHPGPGALGSPDDVRRSARAGWGLRLTSLAAMAPLVAALGYSAGSTPLAITMVVALATGVAAGALLALDRWFSHLPGLVLALSAPMLLAVVAVLAGAGSTALYVLLLHLGAFLWGLDWARVGRLRSQTFLLILPVWLALFSDSPPVRVGSVVVFLLVLATLALASRDELRAVPRLAVGPREAPSTPTTADLIRAAAIALAVGALAWAVLDGRSIVPPSPPDLGDRLSFGDEQVAGDDPTGGSQSSGGGSGSGGGSSGGVPGGDPGFVPNDPGNGPSGTFEGSGSGSGSGSAGGSGDLPFGGEGSAGGADSEGLDLDGDGFVDGFDLDGDGSIDVDPSGDPVDGGPDAADDAPEPPWLLLLGLLLAAVAIALAVWWWRTRDGGPAGRRVGWAEEVAARLGREGARRGRPRSAQESVLVYAGELADGPLPDERLRDVGSILSSALFGLNDASPDQQVWVEDVLEAVLAANPPPGVATAAKARLARTG
jgi:uncharacterized membrane protein YgcG